MIFYFTFGQTHRHPGRGIPMKDYWIEIKADTREIAIAIMNQHYENWGDVYTKNTFAIEHYPKGCFEKILVTTLYYEGNEECTFFTE